MGQVVPARLMAGRIGAVRSGGGAVLVAMEWGPPSGVVAVHWFGSLAQDEPVAQITTLLVGPDARRRGIGRLLVKAASQAARVAGCGVLEVAGAGLEEFCGATGFVQDGARFVRGLRRRPGALPLDLAKG